MGQKRKPITKAVRFEVFKRDKFMCQYCGGAAPNVILEVDHIVPVSKGGGNDIMNLVTACRDCNRGKTNKELSDDSAVAVQKKQLDVMQERREQLEMMIKWRQSLEREVDIQVDAIDEYFRTNTRFELDETGRDIVRALIKRFGLDEVYEASEIAVYQYYRGDLESFCRGVHKLGGICFNRKKGV